MVFSFPYYHRYAMRPMAQTGGKACYYPTALSSKYQTEDGGNTGNTGQNRTRSSSSPGTALEESRWDLGLEEIGKGQQSRSRRDGTSAKA